MSENRLRDYLDHMRQAASDACGFVEGMDKSDFMPPMATPNCSTVGQSNCSRQDGVIMRGLR